MLQCPPECPTVRRQLREQIKRAGWTDEYIRSVVDTHRRVHSVDTTQDLGHKVKSDSRKKPLKPLKKGRQESSIDHVDRYERERGRDDSEPSARDLERVTDYEVSIDDSDDIKDGFEEPVASLVQESIYYTKKKQIARVAPTRRITPKESQQSIPSKISRIKTPKTQSREIGSPITDKEIVVYERGEVDDTAVAYRKELSHKGTSDREEDDYGIRSRDVARRRKPDRRVADREESDYEVASRDVARRRKPDRRVADREESDYEDAAYRRKPGRKVLDHEMAGPSRMMDDRRTLRRRDDSPDDYYKYTPKELASDWPHDGCDETCPANILKERAEKLQKQPRQIDDRYSLTSESYYKDMCTCSLSCMVHSLKKDPLVRSILTSAMLFAIGLKLCSELHGWYLPIRAS